MPYRCQRHGVHTHRTDSRGAVVPDGGGALTICDHRHHRRSRSRAPASGLQLAHCPTHACPPIPRRSVQAGPRSPCRGGARWMWCVVGQRRLPATGRSAIRAELADTYQIRLSAVAIDLHSPLPTDAGGPPPGSRPVGRRVCGRGAVCWPSWLHRGHETLYVVRDWSATGLVCRAPAVQCDDRGPAAAGPGACVGRAVGQTGAALDVG